MKNVIFLTAVFILALRFISSMFSHPVEVPQSDEKKTAFSKSRPRRSIASARPMAATSRKADETQRTGETSNVFTVSSREDEPEVSSGPDTPVAVPQDEKSEKLISGFSGLSGGGGGKGQQIDQSTSKTSSSSVRAAAPASVAARPALMNFQNVKAPATIPPAAGNNTPGTTPETSGSAVLLSCSASLGEGTYKNPSTVGLSCSTPASISYCLQLGGGCCDPKVSGVAYSTDLNIGDSADTYCLSFYGNAGGSTSPVVQKKYVFDPESPHVAVSHPKTYFQTTQLSGSAAITSTDFGNPDFVVGQINTLNMDPYAVTGHNLTCQQLVDTYTTLTPAPVETLIPVSMSSFLITDQINVVLDLPRISYGDNFITTFAAHVNYVEKVACSTTKIVLEDFEYFDANVSFGVPGTNTVREFAGSFTPYGFFEDEATIYRGPAGTTAEAQGGQELRIGLFSVIY